METHISQSDMLEMNQLLSGNIFWLFLIVFISLWMQLDYWSNGRILNAIIKVQQYFDANDGKEIDPMVIILLVSGGMAEAIDTFIVVTVTDWNTGVLCHHKKWNLKTRYSRISNLYKKHHSCNTLQQYDTFLNELDGITSGWSEAKRADLKEYSDKSDFHFRIKIQSQAGSRCGQVSSQARSMNSAAKGETRWVWVCPL